MSVRVFFVRLCIFHHQNYFQVSILFIITTVKILMGRTSPYPATLTVDVVGILCLSLVLTHEHS